MPGFAVQNLGGLAGDSRAVSTQEFIYNYCWEIFDLFETQDKDLLVYAKEATAPVFSVGIENHQGTSLNYKFAKNVTYDDVKITFYDSVGLLRIMKNWRERVWTSDDGIKTAESYKKNSRLLIYPPTWNVNDCENWKLIGSWPSTIRHGDLTYTSSDVKLVEVTVTYDYAEETIGIA